MAIVTRVYSVSLESHSDNLKLENNFSKNDQIECLSSDLVKPIQRKAIDIILGLQWYHLAALNFYPNVLLEPAGYKIKRIQCTLRISSYMLLKELKKEF